MSKRELTLYDFPPKLRELALFLVKNDNPISLKEACTRVRLNYDSICNMIAKSRRKGKDFNDLLNRHSFEYLKSRVSEVDKAMANEAITGTHKDRELFYRRVGILKDSPQISIDNRSITVLAAPPSAIPSDLIDLLPPERGEMTLTGHKDRGENIN